MAEKSVSRIEGSVRASQVQRSWQQTFRERMAGLPPEVWRCVGMDIGKYEHVGVVTDGWGRLLCQPARFSLYQAEVEAFFQQVDELCCETAPLLAMEPTGHYYEAIASAASSRYGQEQLFMVQSHDVAERRKTWNKGTFKNDEVDACIIAQVLSEGHGRPYRPPVGVFQNLYHLERYRLAREQAATRLKNQIIGHVDRLYPGLLVRDRELALKYKPLFRELWRAETPRRLLVLFPNPYVLREHSPESLYVGFREAGYWLNRPYAAKILSAVQQLGLPDPGLAAIRSQLLLADLSSLTAVEQQRAETEAEMVAHSQYTWGRQLASTGVPAIRIACLVATIGDIRQYASARQLFGRSGLHSGCNDSGMRLRKGRGRKIIKPGDRHLRRQLMRFTLSMLPRYPALKRHKAQMLQRGLSRVAAHIALARRLSGMVFAVASSGQPFDPDRFA